MSLASPFRLVRAAINSVRKHVESYDADFKNEDQHGEFLVTLCTDEEVVKKFASCVVVIRPNTRTADLPFLKATLSDQAIHIEGPATSKPYLDHSDKWLGILNTNQQGFHASKLLSVMKALVTKQKRGKRIKTTTINFSSHNMILSNEYFNRGITGEKELKMIPLPFTYDMTIGNERRTVTELVCVERAYIEGSLQDVEEEANTTTDSDYELMLKMMNGATI